RSFAQLKGIGGRASHDSILSWNRVSTEPGTVQTALQTWPCISKFSDWNAVNQEWELVKTQEW
ncbi:hypothetical protein, partial [Streptomyces sp. NPDC058304]|uniref:hypothetical protein n=1 Tax=Streptomyces sp. NPDC058304 TaxID=3346437 RepID=UPI0036E382DC